MDEGSSDDVSISKKRVRITVIEESVAKIDDVRARRKPMPKRRQRPGTRRNSDVVTHSQGDAAGEEPLKHQALFESGPSDQYPKEDPLTDLEDQDSNSEPLIIFAEKSKSIDLCPQCNAGLNALSGGYSLNLVTFDITVTCVCCRKLIVIKNSFTDLKAFDA